MRINNENRKFQFQLINTIFLLTVLLYGVGYFIIPNLIKTKLFYYGIVVIAIFIFFKWRGFPFFSYDSEGETLYFENKDLNLLIGDPKMVKRAEFPKRKLLGFKVRNYFVKKVLYLTVESKRSDSEKTRQKFDITYLKNNELKDLKRSLHKVIQQVKESKQKNELRG